MWKKKIVVREGRERENTYRWASHSVAFKKILRSSKDIKFENYYTPVVWHSWLFGNILMQWFSTRVPWQAHWGAARIVKTYNTWLVSQGADLFSLRLSNKKSDNSQCNSSCWVWINWNYTCFLLVQQKMYFWCAAEF